MKRVLIFSLTYMPLIGGAEVAIKEITDRLGHDDDFEWDLITLRPNTNMPKFENIGNVNVYRVGLFSNQSTDLVRKDFFFNLNKLLFPLGACIKAVFLNREKKYNAVWSIMAAYAGLAGLFFKFFNPKTKFILTLQEGDTSGYVKNKAGIFVFLIKKIFTKADYIHAISNYLVNFAKDFGCKKKVIVIPNGVDLSKFKAQSTKLNSSRNRIITTSRLIEKNGIRDLILSLKYLRDDFILDILGTGPLYNDLIRITNDNNLSQRVFFRGGLGQEEMIRYINNADVFVRPSLSEGLGNSFLEAMAVGLPIIATKVGGIPDFLIDKETGLFCQVNNPRDIAEKIIMINTDFVLRNKLIMNGKKLIENQYGWGIIVKKFKLEIFDKIG